MPLPVMRYGDDGVVDVGDAAGAELPLADVSDNRTSEVSRR